MLNGQIRLSASGVHIQVAGPQGNRPYGWSMDIPAEKLTFAMGRALARTEGNMPSLTGSAHTYMPCQIGDDGFRVNGEEVAVEWPQDFRVWYTGPVEDDDEETVEDHAEDISDGVVVASWQGVSHTYYVVKCSK